MSANRNHLEIIQKDLENFFEQGNPSDQVLQRMEEKLIVAHSERSSTPSVEVKRKLRGLRFNWVTASLVAILLVLVLVMTIGPAQVYAQVRALLGYLPGIGFVDGSDARVILRPVSQSQEEITITVIQVFADSEGTYVMLNIEGLPPEQEIYDSLHQFIKEHESEWPQLEPEMWRTQASLTLPDGSILDEQHYSGAPWEGYYLFPPLPEDVLEFEFKMDRIPGLIPDVAPHDWQFMIQMDYIPEPGSTPILDEYEGEYRPTLLTPIAVEVPSEPDQVYGFQLEVQDVVYAQTETVVRVFVSGVPQGWATSLQGPELGNLVDDLGHQYEPTYGPGSGTQMDGSTVHSFEPLQPGAKTLTLSLSNLSFFVPVDNQAIKVDFGASPQPGDYFPVDQTIEVLGIPINIKGLRLRQEKAHTEGQPLLSIYEFDIAPVPVKDGVAIIGIGFVPDMMERLGSDFGGGGGGGGGGWQEDPSFSTFSLEIGVSASAPLPEGLFEFPVELAQIMLEGPYSVTWEIGR